MCGIYGELSSSLSPSRIVAGESTLRQLAHRGPDGEGLFHDKHCLLGHRRLSILDLSNAAAQPMHSASGRAVIVFNGELYNYVELKNAMPPPAGGWRSKGDTEVLLELVEREGLAALEGAIGMFAFAVWFAETKELWLCRDRFGKKPLFYTTMPNGDFRFSSELPPLLSDPAVSRNISRARIAEFLQLGYIAPPHTPFDAIRSVPPAHWLVVKVNDSGAITTRLQRYWSLPTQVDASVWRAGTWFEAFEQTLLDAVRIRLRSDVPMSALLSGGIDSSVIAVMAAKLTGQPLSTIAVDTGDESSETAWAAQVARHIGTRHQTVQLQPFDADSIGYFVRLFPELMGDASALAATAAFDALKGHSAVTLTGDGGDELLSGYTRYALTLHSVERAKRLPAQVSRLASLAARRVPTWAKGEARLNTVNDEVDQAYLSFVHCYPTHDTPPLMRDVVAEPTAIELAQARYRNLPAHLRMQFVDAETYVPHDTMVVLDRASMANSIEVRSPFFDQRLFELVAQAPFDALVRDGSPKYPLRRSFAHQLPRSVFERTKMGFTVPLRRWLGEVDLRGLGSNASPLAQVLDQRAVRTMVTAFRGGINQHLGRLWHLLVLERWLSEWNATIR